MTTVTYSAHGELIEGNGSSDYNKALSLWFMATVTYSAHTELTHGNGRSHGPSLNLGQYIETTGVDVLSGAQHNRHWNIGKPAQLNHTGRCTVRGSAQRALKYW